MLPAQHGCAGTLGSETCKRREARPASVRRASYVSKARADGKST